MSSRHNRTVPSTEPDTSKPALLVSPSLPPSPPQLVPPSRPPSPPHKPAPVSWPEDWELPIASTICALIAVAFLAGLFCWCCKRLAEHIDDRYNPDCTVRSDMNEGFLEKGGEQSAAAQDEPQNKTTPHEEAS